MTGFLPDLRFSARALARNPLHASIVIATFAVGVAACTLVVGVVNAVLYRPFDAYPDAGRLVLLFEQNARQNVIGPAAPANMKDWRRAARSFELMGGIAPASMTVTGSGEAETLFGVAVTDGIPGLVNATVQAGRAFDSADYLPAAPPTVLVTHGLWQRRFAGSRDVVGRVLTLNGRGATVAGVLARGVTLKPLLGVEPEIVAPLAVESSTDRAARSMMVVARLKPGVTVPEASREMQTIAARLAATDEADRGWGVYVKPARGLDLQGDAGFIVVLGVGVAFVLLIVCANIANLLLVRAAGRAKEIATRRAIGAGTFPIVRLVLTEVALLGCVGGVAAIVLAWWACRALAWWLSGTNFSVFDIQVDARVASFTLAVSSITALAAGAVAAIRLARAPVSAGLTATIAGSARLSAGRLRQTLVAFQVGLALVLLVGSGLVLKGVVNLRQNDPGFRSERLATAFSRLSDGRYDQADARTTFISHVLARLTASGEVEAAAASDFRPAVGAEMPIAPFSIEGRPADGKPASAGLIAVSDQYFRTLGVPVKAGRTFTAGDRAGAVPVAVVNERLARRSFPGRSPLGARVNVDGVPRTIVGIVGDVRNFHLNVAPAAAVYVPLAQRPGRGIAWFARMRSDDAPMLPLLKAAVRSIDANQPVSGGDPMRRAIERTMGGFDMTAVVVAVLALIALALASVGVFGVVAYSVARRTREIGIRMALGASPSRVVAQVVRHEMRVATIGLVPGLLLAAAVGRLLASKLPRVMALEPLILAGSLLAVSTAVVCAAYVPARRAAQVDPSLATKAE